MIVVDGADEDVRLAHGRARPVLHRRCRGGRGPARAERRGQDDHAPVHGGHPGADGGHGPDRRPRHRHRRRRGEAPPGVHARRAAALRVPHGAEHLALVARLYGVGRRRPRVPTLLEELELDGKASGPAVGAVPRDEAEAGDRVRPAAPAVGDPVRRAAHRARSAGHPAHEGDDCRREPQRAPP